MPLNVLQNIFCRIILLVKLPQLLKRVNDMRIFVQKCCWLQTNKVILQ